MEASALTHADRPGLLVRHSPLLRLKGDEHLVALTRAGEQYAFDALVQRYQSRLLGFCRQMLGSTEDAEDVLQEVFVAAYKAMVADDRPIAVKPWLYRIARNRCLNHLRKPTADGVDTMDVHPHEHGTTTHDRVQNRQDFRDLLADVDKLPETQRTALLLREIDAMSYEEIAQAMDTTVPGIKSLLVRARIALAESSQARQLTCGEVRVELAEAAEGLAKVSGPVRRHIKGCESCHDFRGELRSSSKALAALFPAGPLLALKGFLVAKLGFGSGGGAAAGGSGAAAAGAGGSAASGAAIGGAAAVGGTSAASGIGAVGAAVGAKAAAGLATAALITAGAVEIKKVTSSGDPGSQAAKAAAVKPAPPVAAPVPVAEPAPVPLPAPPVAEKVVEPTPVPVAEEGKAVPAAEGAIQDKKPQATANSDSGTTTGGVVTTTPAGGTVPPPCEAAVDPACEPASTAPTGP